jgi:hypothetical protein
MPDNQLLIYAGPAFLLCAAVKKNRALVDKKYAPGFSLCPAKGAFAGDRALARLLPYSCRKGYR